MQEELKVDMDWRPPKSWLDYWESNCKRLLHMFSTASLRKIKKEKSEHGYHFRFILWNPVDDEYALLWQFLLGDDRVRCKLNYWRWKAGIKDWNKLWKCKVGRDNGK